MTTIESNEPGAPKAVAPLLPAKSARYQMLDFWRGLSCLALVVFHATMQLVHQGFSFEGSTWERVGAALTAVAARNFNQPPTLSSPTNFPIGIVFLQPIVLPVYGAGSPAAARGP